jgi:methylated-DNA-[protein]-cysteine S-methyltransferase
MMYWHEAESPVGNLLLVSDGTSLKSICFRAGRQPSSIHSNWVADPKPFERVLLQLQEYFAGRRRQFDLPLDAPGTTFQHRVWQQLSSIPFGETISYGELARRIGNPRAARAVGLANGANPLPIVVPCHRVIGVNGSLTGFGGGLPIKQRLLSLEAAWRWGAAQLQLPRHEDFELRVR